MSLQRARHARPRPVRPGPQALLLDAAGTPAPCFLPGPPQSAFGAGCVPERPRDARDVGSRTDPAWTELPSSPRLRGAGPASPSRQEKGDAGPRGCVSGLWMQSCPVTLGARRVGSRAFRQRLPPGRPRPARPGGRGQEQRAPRLGSQCPAAPICGPGETSCCPHSCPVSSQRGAGGPGDPPCVCPHI